MGEFKSFFLQCGLLFWNPPSLLLSSEIPAASSAYWKSDTMFDLKYCNWNKDMLMGVLPNSQFGDVAVLDVP